MLGLGQEARYTRYEYYCDEWCYCNTTASSVTDVYDCSGRYCVTGQGLSMVLCVEITSAPTPTPSEPPSKPPTPPPTEPPTPPPTPTPSCDDTAEDQSCGGDPHFKMWGDQHFSFHGQCDLLVFSNPNFAFGAGLIIQIRTQIKKYYSFINNIALEVRNQSFEIEGNRGQGVNFYLNGKSYAQPITKFAGYHVRKVEDATWCKEKCSEAEIYNFDFETLGTVEVGNWGSFLHLRLSLEPSSYNASVGLLGTYGEVGFFARDGTILHSANLYGHEWQVLDTEPMLFHETKYPQYPEQCIMPKLTARRIIDEETHRMAETVCSHLSGSLFDMCVFDVEATGDERMAISPLYV